MIYRDFADIYDELMYDVDYRYLADYIEDLLDEVKCRPKLVLDLACGTGNLAVELARKEYEVIGIDFSADMLNVARHKCLEAGVDVLLINQDMRSFELYGTVDAVFCIMDSINYITAYNDVVNVFKLVENYLNPGGVFIFDVNTEYKMKQVLAGEVFYDIGSDLAYIWQNKYDEKEKICTLDLTFFIKKNDECYRRIDEVHKQRAFSHEEILKALKDSALEYIASYNALSKDKPSRSSERVFYLARKKGSQKGDSQKGDSSQ